MKQTIKLIFFLLLIQTVRAQTIIGGVFFSDTVISVAHSPYHVISNMLVPVGVTVTIEPGVAFFFAPDIFFQIEGELRAKGAESDSIIFQLQAGSSGQWRGLKFTNQAIPYNKSDSSGCIIDYCIFSKAENAIWMGGVGVAVFHSEIKNCGGGIIAYGGGIFIEYNSIHHCTGQAITTSYDVSYPSPVIIDHCEIYSMNGNSDIIRLTRNAALTNCSIYNCSGIAALSVWAGPYIKVSCNSFYNNNTNALLLISSPYNLVEISGNDFTNNKINLTMSSCYKIPTIRNNNFYSYTDYHVYCTDRTALGDNECEQPNGSFFTLDMQQNYFAHSSLEQLDSSIYDLYDNWIGRTIISYDTSIMTPYTNSLDCSGIFNSIATASDPLNFLSVFPNPTDGQLNIQLDDNVNGKVSLYIYDAIGANVYQHNCDNSQSLIQLNLSDLQSGFYYLVVESGSLKRTKKFCII